MRMKAQLRLLHTCNLLRHNTSCVIQQRDHHSYLLGTERSTCGIPTGAVVFRCYLLSIRLTVCNFHINRCLLFGQKGRKVGGKPARRLVRTWLLSLLYGLYPGGSVCNPFLDCHMICFVSHRPCFTILFSTLNLTH